MINYNEHTKTFQVRLILETSTENEKMLWLQSIPVSLKATSELVMWLEKKCINKKVHPAHRSHLIIFDITPKTAREFVSYYLSSLQEKSAKNENNL